MRSFGQTKQSKLLLLVKAFQELGQKCFLIFYVTNFERY